MNHIFITGATGALGSELIPRFLNSDSTRVTILVRASSEEELAIRRQKLLDYLGISPESNLTSRVEAVRGDASLPGLGLPDNVLRQLSETVTHLVHAAGNVKLNQPFEAARKTAVDSASYIVNLTEQCLQRGPLRKLEFVSTVGVAGRRANVVKEERFSGSFNLSDFHNTYEASKWLAEQYLWDAIDKGLPATIHRPSMIVGDAIYGRIIHFQVFYHLTDFLIGRKTWGVVPKTNGATLDIIPVDYVADAICMSALEQLGQGQVWHLCSGPKLAIDLDELVMRIRELLLARNQPLPKLKKIGLQLFRTGLGAVSLFVGERKRRFLRGLPFLLDYLESKQQFDNALTNQLLENRGLAIRPVNDYLETVMEPFWNRHVQSKA